MKIIAAKVFQLKQLKRRNLKNSGLNGNGTHDPSAIPVQRTNQLSYQANWELVNCEFVFIP